jgi:RNA polymerase sigma-70 factor (ECF subfamily)
MTPINNQLAATLLRQISEGDEKAFADFYRLFEKKLFNFIVTKLNDSFEANDILHETFMEVWRNAGNFEGRSKVSTWLFGIAYFKTMDKFRKRKESQLEDDHLDLLEDSDGDLYHCTLSDQQEAHIRHCLETLKTVQKEVLHLAFYAEFSYREIGEITHSPENTVKTRVFHAKQAMQHCLNARMGDAR